MISGTTRNHNNSPKSLYRCVAQLGDEAEGHDRSMAGQAWATRSRLNHRAKADLYQAKGQGAIRVHWEGASKRIPHLPRAQDQVHQHKRG